MTTTVQVITMGELPIAPRAVTDWNLVLVAGEWQDTSTALNSPIFGTVFKGTVDVISKFVVIQTLRTKDGSVKTFQRASFEGSGNLIWGAWEEKANYSAAELSALTSTLAGKQDKANLVTSFSITPLDTEYPSAKLVKDSLDALPAPDLSGYEVLSHKNNTILNASATEYPTSGLVKEELEMLRSELALISQNLIYTPMVLGGFHENIVTMAGEVKIPIFVCDEEGRVLLTKLGV